MDKQALWDQACQIMHLEMTEVTFNTWIRSALRPLGVSGDQFFIEAVTDFYHQLNKQEPAHYDLCGDAHRMKHEFVRFLEIFNNRDFEADYQLLDHLNWLQNVLLPARYGKKDGKRADEIFETIGLQGYQRRRINDLSGGEKQRIAIGRCLMSGNPLILADEPTGSLDSANAMMIMNLLREMCLSGYSVIVVTHDKEVAGLCDRVLELKDGVIYQ